MAQLTRVWTSVVWTAYTMWGAPGLAFSFREVLQPEKLVYVTYWLILMGWHVSELLSLTDILFIRQMIWVWRATVEWYWQGKTEELWEKPVPMPLVLHKSYMDWPGPPRWEAFLLTAWAYVLPSIEAEPNSPEKMMIASLLTAHRDSRLRYGQRWCVLSQQYEPGVLQPSWPVSAERRGVTDSSNEDRTS
jgi:hypothetical protein